MSETKDWMVPAFPVELRQRVVAAARARQVTVAEWLVALLTDDKIDGNAVQAVRALPQPRQDGPPLGELVSCAVALAGAQGVPRGLRRAANRAVKQRYELLNGPPKPRIAAPKPQPEGEMPISRQDNAASC